MTATLPREAIQTAMTRFARAYTMLGDSADRGPADEALCEAIHEYAREYAAQVTAKWAEAENQLGILSAERDSIKADALRILSAHNLMEKERDVLRKTLDGWLHANGPNGWITVLRLQLEQLEKLAADRLILINADRDEVLRLKSMVRKMQDIAHGRETVEKLNTDQMRRDSIFIEQLRADVALLREALIGLEDATSNIPGDHGPDV